MRTFSFVLGSLVAASLLANPASAQGPNASDATPASTSPAASALQLTVPFAPEGIRVDGNLDEQEWAGAVRVDAFTELLPKEGKKPQVRTEALLMYDRAYLYIAFRAYDDPSKIRASLRERDKVFADDWVLASIDTYGESNWAYGIGANPLGVQLDLRDEGMNGDPSLDVLFGSAGRITADGYQVELAIPFSSLRFPQSEVHSWRINLIRNHPRQDRQIYTWAPLTLNNPCFLCQAGTVTGMTEIRSGGRLDVLPSLVASQTGALTGAGAQGASFANGSPGADVGVGVKYDLGGGWTAEATYNPDFSQVESDAAQIDVNSVMAIQYPERRPFFQEGAELFNTPLPVVYSRSINNPLWAGKLNGRVGAMEVSMLTARDESTPLMVPLDGRSLMRQTDVSTSSVVRAKYNLSSGSYIGAILSDRRFGEGGSGTSISLDGSHRFRTNYQLAYQLVGSHTQELDAASAQFPADLRFGADDRFTVALDGESYSGTAGHLSLSRRDKRSSLSLSYDEASPTYRADNGFQRRNDYRDVSLEGGLVFQPRTKLVTRVNPGVELTTGWTYSGEDRLRSVEPSLFVELTGQTMAEISAEYRDESFGGTSFEGLRRASLYVGSNFSERASLGAYLSHGDGIARFLATPERGRETSVSTWATLKPVQNVVIEPSVSFASMSGASGEELYSGYVARTKFNYQFTRELVFRVTAQYNDFSGRLDVDPLLTYRVNPYTLFYVGSTHDVDWSDHAAGPVLSQRQVFLKMQYLLRR